MPNFNFAKVLFAILNSKCFPFDLPQIEPPVVAHERDDGVLVASVDPDSAAYRGGIRPGMIILSVNRKKVDSVEQFNAALGDSVESKKVLLLVRAQRYTQFVVLPLE